MQYFPQVKSPDGSNMMLERIRKRSKTLKAGHNVLTHFGTGCFDRKYRLAGLYMSFRGELSNFRTLLLLGLRSVNTFCCYNFTGGQLITTSKDDAGVTQSDRILNSLKRLGFEM